MGIQPTQSSDNFEMEYKEKPEIVKSLSHLLEKPAAKASTGEVLHPDHESNKTNHYSKLGSAFVTKNAMGRMGGRGTGRGRGRGL